MAIHILPREKQQQDQEEPSELPRTGEFSKFSRFRPRSSRILIVTPRFHPYTGGVENHVYEVARRMVQEGWDITVLTTDPSWKLPKSEIIEGIPVQRVRAWPKNADYYFAPDLVQAISQGDWDLMHVQSYHTFVPPLAMLTAQRRHIPYVVTFHGGGHSSWLRNSVRGLQHAILKPLLQNAARLVTIAHFEKKWYGTKLEIPAERFAFIPNGCDLPKQPSRSASRPGNLIASVGRLERYKGHHRVISAMPYILNEKPDARLWIAGKGPFESELKNLASEIGVQDHVEIRAVPGADRKTMAAELSKVSLAVLLSEFETHPIAILEAVSLGIPALVADNSGLSELADSGLAQSIPLCSNDRQVARAMLQQLEHPLIPPTVDLPTWDDCARGLCDLYQDILQNSGQCKSCEF